MFQCWDEHNTVNTLVGKCNVQSKNVLVACVYLLDGIAEVESYASDFCVLHGLWSPQEVLDDIIQTEHKSDLLFDGTTFSKK